MVLRPGCVVIVNSESKRHEKQLFFVSLARMPPPKPNVNISRTRTSNKKPRIQLIIITMVGVLFVLVGVGLAVSFFLLPQPQQQPSTLTTIPPVVDNIKGMAPAKKTPGAAAGVVVPTVASVVSEPIIMWTGVLVSVVMVGVGLLILYRCYLPFKQAEPEPEAVKEPVVIDEEENSGFFNLLVLVTMAIFGFIAICLCVLFVLLMNKKGDEEPFKVVPVDSSLFTYDDADIRGKIIANDAQFFLGDDVTNRRFRNNVYFTVGDITKQHVDAISNAANEGGLWGGGVDGAIHDAIDTALAGKHNVPLKGYTGYHFTDYLAKALVPDSKGNRCPVGTAKPVAVPHADLQPGKIRFQAVLQATGPGKTSKNREAELKQTYTAILETCQNNGIRHVVIPLISTGIFGGTDVGETPKWVLTAIEEWLNDNPSSNLMIVLIFPNNQHALIKTYKQLILN